MYFKKKITQFDGYVGNFAPCKGIQNPGKFCFRNPGDTAQGIWNPTNGYFDYFNPHPSFPVFLHFPKWQLSQISHLGGIVDVKVPTDMHFMNSKFQWVAPPPLSWGKPLIGTYVVLFFADTMCD